MKVHNFSKNVIYMNLKIHTDLISCTFQTKKLWKLQEKVLLPTEFSYALWGKAMYYDYMYYKAAGSARLKSIIKRVMAFIWVISKCNESIYCPIWNKNI